MLLLVSLSSISILFLPVVAGTMLFYVLFIYIIMVVLNHVSLYGIIVDINFIFWLVLIVDHFTSCRFVANRNLS